MRCYSNEKNTLLLISLLKQHGISRVIISPGAQNICFVGSLQHDSYFELYSAPDERSAAYMACGMAAADGRPVALSCTGATASRNYIPGLTEAYYRHLPVLAITSTKHTAFVGQNVPQVIDRSLLQKDIARMSVYIPTIENKDDMWGATVDINAALLELTHRGGGPVHINLETTHSFDYSVTELPKARAIFRIDSDSAYPQIPAGKKIAIFVGTHGIWETELQKRVEKFCEKYNAVVLCDHSSNYHGKYKILPALVSSQDQYRSNCIDIDLLIDIGNISGAYYRLNPKRVWRVDPEGDVKDPFRALRYVFEMPETEFFRHYADDDGNYEKNNTQYNDWVNEHNEIMSQMPELPFSNLWIAGKMSSRLPDNCVLHLAILNSFRSWNYFYISEKITCFCNTGGFGIDGPVSAALGSALIMKDKLHILVTGDLAFFYDMNALGNRHMPGNLRILLINNGIGTEFKNYNHKAAAFGGEADLFMAAAGHYGNKSRELVKHYSQDLGFQYLSAGSKETLLECIPVFLSEDCKKPVLLEVFTDSQQESDAYKAVRNIKMSLNGSGKKMITRVLGKENTRRIKQILKR